MPNRFERFIGNINLTPNRRIDLKRTLGNVGGEPKSDHEIAGAAYINSLMAKDKVGVVNFLSFAQELGNEIFVKAGIQIAVIAVGSTTRPKVQRPHEARDIDLRILNSDLTYSKYREATIGTIRNAVREYLTNSHIEFEEHGSTASTRIADGYRGGKIESRPSDEWYNDDSSFVTKNSEGLPLHISISGVDNWDLKTYLHEERRRNGHFAVLYER